MTASTAGASAQSTSTGNPLAGLSARQILRLGAHPDDRVIVLLRNQQPDTAGRFSSLAKRRSELHSDQQPVLDELAALHAKRVHGYGLIDAVSATVTKSEAQRLARQPEVSAVVPDQKVSLPVEQQPTPASAPSNDTVTNNEPNICTGTQASPQIEPEALSLIHADSTDVGGVDGSGVKIAVFPDGIDNNPADVPDFVRGGSSVIGDYQDFTGEGTTARTGGGEAFGDVSSIAAQGNTAFNLADEVSKELPLPSDCWIRIVGAAPGATVDVMKVFGSNDATFSSVILRGLDYAVETDHVNVLSESFGSNGVPQPTDDPISLFNNEAVRNGITVVTSTGDSGTSNTIGSPASSSGNGIVAVGATTSFRAIAQTGLYGAPWSEQNHDSNWQGWQNNNVSSLSSAGTTEYGPTTLDLVAPGDSGWADCAPATEVGQFTDCAEQFDASDPSIAPAIELFGGTSESCPLTAATAALVIQAYENSHGGAAPSPELVKQLITSTAQPLQGVPAQEQGSGLVDAAAAVHLAESVNDGSTAATAGQLLVSTDRISRVGGLSEHTRSTVTLTNPAASPVAVTPRLVSLGASKTLANKSFTYLASGTSSTPAYPSPTGGGVRPYYVDSVTVPANQARLVVRAAWNDTSGHLVNVSLFDPDGNLVNSSDAQGYTGFAEVEAAEPQQGTWHVVFFRGRTSYSGPVRWTAFSQVASTSALPAVTVPAGGSHQVSVPVTTPSSAGDRATSVEFDSGGVPATGQVAVVTRARIPVSRHHAGRFSTSLTGGNGRQFFFSQEQPFQLTVPRHTPEINVDVTVQGSGYQLYGSLVDPSGLPIDTQGTPLATSRGRIVRNLRTLQLSVFHPVAGQWHFDLTLVGVNVSTGTSVGVNGSVNFNTHRVSRRGLPRSTRVRIRKGHRLTAHITIRNDGNSEREFFLDPRLTSNANVLLPSLNPSTGRLPMRVTDEQPVFALPPFARQLVVVERARDNATGASVADRLEVFGVIPGIGDATEPDVISAAGRSPSVTINGRQLPSAGYACAPQPAGATDGGMPAATFNCAAAASMKALARMVTSSTGDFWSNGRFRPVTLRPGRRRTITVHLRGTGHRGSRVRGFIAVESLDPETLGTDVTAELPFRFTVG